MDPGWQVFSLGKSERLTQPIQMQLYWKLKIFPELFSKFLKFTWNFKHFEEKDEPHSWFISEVVDCKKRLYLNP